MDISKDKETGEEIIAKEMLFRKHGKNCWAGIKQCNEARIYYMAFRNGGTSVDTMKIVYKHVISEAFECKFI